MSSIFGLYASELSIAGGSDTLVREAHTGKRLAVDFAGA
jgi:hypothetical protein